MKEALLGLDVKKRNEGHEKDLKKAIWNVNKIIRPAFRRHNLTIKLKAGLDAGVMRAPTKAAEWSNPQDRIIGHTTHGILSIANPIGKPKKFIGIQPTYSDTIHDVYRKREPRFDISRSIVNTTDIHDRIPAILEVLRFNHVFYFMMTGTKRFWAGRYEDIPIEYFTMDYRQNPSVPDRLIIRPEWYEINHPYIDEYNVMQYLLDKMIHNENR